ncbi:Crp/Fnr family transcriptional regulator [Mesorhizobium sp. CAU 1732]|uniref:Crp/Fnr family transcriptional regulator n=1 Tax=Mesorhizobium sp. CAU 1732 TaxID=3140358 RepID=UPI003260A4C2
MTDPVTPASIKIHTWRDMLSPQANSDLQIYLRERRVRAGEMLYRFGEEATCGYQILSGHVEINCYTADGREYVVGSLYPGDTLGDIGLVNGGLRFNNAVALIDSKVSILSRSDYQSLICKHPEISRKVAEMLGYRYQSLFALAQDAYLLPLYHRLGRTIVRLALFQNGTPPPEPIILQNCSQEKLGLMVGAARQSVGRELKRMEALGLIRINYANMVVQNFAAMASMFGSVVDYEPIMSDQFGFVTT